MRKSDVPEFVTSGNYTDGCTFDPHGHRFTTGASSTLSGAAADVSSPLTTSRGEAEMAEHMPLQPKQTPLPTPSVEPMARFAHPGDRY